VDKIAILNSTGVLLPKPGNEEKQNNEPSGHSGPLWSFFTESMNSVALG
jgi:hypothetical protein